MKGKSSSSADSSDNLDNNLQSGSPNEDRTSNKTVRPGQLDWVTPIKTSADLKRWAFQFRFGAEVYLSKTVYPNENERSVAWINALLRAATQGGFSELEDLIALFHSKKFSCENLLKTFL